MTVISPTAGSREAPSLDVTVRELLAALRYRSWRVIVSGVVLGGLLVVHGLNKPVLYAAHAGFVAEAPQPSGAGAIPVGITLRADPLTSPFLYTQLLSSNGFLLRVVDAPLIVRGTDSLSWTRIAAGTEGSLDLRRQLAAEALRRSLDYRVAPLSGVVSVTVRTTDREISGALMRALLGELSRFGTEVRRQRAREEVSGLEQRLVQVSTEANDAEQRVIAFRTRNRDVTNSASLTMERQRLEREMLLRRQRHLAVGAEYAEAKANVTRIEPGVIVVNDPIASAVPEPRGIVARFLMGLIAGAGLAAVLTLALDRRAATAAHAEAR